VTLVLGRAIGRGPTFVRMSRLGGIGILNIQLSIDRFEGDKKQVAVLLTGDGTLIIFPRALLPKGVKAGDVLSFTIEKDNEATKKVAQDTRVVQADLKKTDPGGNIKL
jgi:hypothetical protein